MWERRLRELLEFRRVHGHVNVPRGWPENPRLATWVANQRRLIDAAAVDASRLKLLQESGISWDGVEARREVQRAAWDRMFAALRAFKQQTGHLNVPRSRSALAAWIATQRFLRKRKALAGDRESKLQALGFEWTRVASPSEPRDTRADLWQRSLDALRDYKEKHGDCAVPARWPEDRKLAQWVVNQRSLKKQGRLPRERIEALDRVGFLWSGGQRRASALDRRWEDMLGRLAAFAKHHGHSGVPLGWRDDPALGAWVSRQRHERRRGTLRPERVKRLQSLRFEWAPVESKALGWKKTWETMFAALKRSLKGRDHAVIRDRALVRWIGEQRRLHQKGRLSPDRRRRLEGVGLSWTSREQKWEAKFEELASWRRIHGSCDVPMAAEKGGALARWVSAQRADFKSGRLARSRISRLEALGFRWDGTVPRRDLVPAH
jgi:hypothetical protein